MKIRRCNGGIRISNYPKTFIGISWALAFPLLLFFAAADVFSNGPETNFLPDLFLTCIVFLPMYIIWLIRDFRTTILCKHIDINENGITESKVIGKGKFIPWAELDEYACEITPPPYRTSANFFKIHFSSREKKTYIQTWTFPEQKKERFRNEIFNICDKYFSKNTYGAN